MTRTRVLSCVAGCGRLWASSTYGGVETGVRQSTAGVSVPQCHHTHTARIMSLKDVVGRLSKGAVFDALDVDVRRAAVEELLRAETPDVLKATFLTQLAQAGESAETVELFSKVLMEKAVACSGAKACADIVGTGGDGKNTLNISTPASFLAAASGVPVAKHGNRSASSNSGSADVAEYLGGCLMLAPEQVCSVLDATDYVFVFAPAFHPSLKPMAPVRSAMGIKTVFNILGPLLNPTQPAHMVVGVGAKAKADVVVGALAKNPNLRCLVVHSEDGLDKISPVVPTHAWWIAPGAAPRYQLLKPSDFGLPDGRDGLKGSYFNGGGEPYDNAAWILSVLDGSATGVDAEFVQVNAAALVHVAGKAASFKEGMDVVRSAIASGRARELVDQYVRKSTHAGKANSSDILARIVKRRRVDLVQARARLPQDKLEAEAKAANETHPTVSIADTLAPAGHPHSNVGICAELKRASPSEGDISSTDILKLAAAYTEAQVQVISVLTEPVWFKGTLADLAAVRKVVSSVQSRPAVLRKDFVFSKYQILEARKAGADSLLLIVAIEDAMRAEGESLASLIAYAREWGMEPLVEVVAEEEVDIAVKAGARVIGVNNRDLKTFKVDLNRTGELIKYAAANHPADAVKHLTWVGLSGVSKAQHVSDMKGQGADAVLVGTSLMRSDDPKAMIKEWQAI